MSTVIQAIGQFANGWGPYILAFCGVLASVTAWSIKRLLARLDSIAETVATLIVELAVVKSRISTAPQRRQDKEDANNE